MIKRFSFPVTLVCGALFIVFSNAVHAQKIYGKASPKELGEAVFETLQKNDFKSFLNLIATDADVDTIVKYATASDSAKYVVRNRMKYFVFGVNEHAKNNFNEVEEKANNFGVDWKKTVIKDIKYDIRNKKNVLSTDVLIHCEQEETTFTIKLNNCHKSTAWLMMDKVDIDFEE